MNSFSESPCFKHLLHELLSESTRALKVGTPDASLTADYLHATITRKLQLSITAEPCHKTVHIMETDPATGVIRIDAELLKHLRSLLDPERQPTGSAAPDASTIAIFKALVMVKLLHEVAHQHTRGLMFHIRATTRHLYPNLLISDDTPLKLCTYVAGRAKKTKFAGKGKLVRRGEMGIAMETALLGAYSLQLPPNTAYACLTKLIAHHDDDDDDFLLITPTGIDRLQPERFTAQCQDSKAFFIGTFLKLDTPKRRKTGDTEPGQVRSALKHDAGDDVADQLEEGSGEEVSEDSGSDDDDSYFGYEVRDAESEDLWPYTKA